MTPVIPVIGAFTKTPSKRCMKDLVVKGRVSSLNLVKLVLRFAIGKHAMSSDLSQINNVLKRGQIK